MHGFHDHSQIQDFEADFVWKIGLKMLYLAKSKSFSGF